MAMKLRSPCAILVSSAALGSARWLRALTSQRLLGTCMKTSELCPCQMPARLWGQMSDVSPTCHGSYMERRKKDLIYSPIPNNCS